MRIFIYSILLSIIFSFTNISNANTTSCNDFKNLIIKNYSKYITQPEKNKINGFGFEPLSYYDEDDNYIYDFEAADYKGFYIERILNPNLQDQMNQGDIVISINDTNLEKIIANNEIKKASEIIDNLLLIDKAKFEIKRYEGEITFTELIKESYNHPTEVEIESIIEDVINIDVKRNEYTNKYMYMLEWEDKRFFDNLNKTSEKYCTYKINENSPFLNSIWYPEIIEENKVQNLGTYKNFNKGDLTFQIYPDEEWNNTVYVILEIYNSAVFNSEFNLSEFPFDIQDFWMNFYTPTINTEVLLKKSWDVDNYEAGKSFFLNNITHPEWNYKNINTEIWQQPYLDGTFYDNFQISINAERKFIYYLAKVIAPIFLILIICWSVFWIEGRELESRLTVTIVSLLALIAYNYVVDEDLPKLGYTTILDKIILCAYIFAALSTLLTVYSHKYCKKFKTEFSKVDIQSRFLGPISYLLINLYLIIGGIKSMNTAEFMGRFLN